MQLVGEPAEALLGREDGLGDAAQPQGARGGLADGGEVEGLAQIVAGAEPERLPRGLDGLVGREHDDLHVGIDLLEVAQHLDAGAARHADVEDGDMHGIVARKLDRLFAVLDGMHAEIVLEDHAQRKARAFLVVDDEHGRQFRGGRGEGGAARGGEPGSWADCRRWRAWFLG